MELYVQESYGFFQHYADIHSLHSTTDLSEDLPLSMFSTTNESNASFLSMGIYGIVSLYLSVESAYPQG